MQNTRLYGAMLATALTVGSGAWAQTNRQETHEAKKTLKQQERADKAQAKADKAERKALNTRQMKKADKAQDKANHEAEKAADLQPQK